MRELDLVWLSDPGAKHSRNIRANEFAAVAVYDLMQIWGQSDRGIQIFGPAREVEGSAADGFEALYAARFPDFSRLDQHGFRVYVLRPLRLKLFDENELGTGVFVKAHVRHDGRVAWERTDIYRSGT
jgi:uncharacterized protein YhbP (UPF0306 family)